MNNGDLNVLQINKGNERYVFIFDDANRAEALRTFGRFASRPELSFTWYDAAVLSNKVRTMPKHPASRITIEMEDF